MSQISDILGPKTAFFSPKHPILVAPKSVFDCKTIGYKNRQNSHKSRRRPQSSESPPSRRVRDAAKQRILPHKKCFCNLPDTTICEGALKNYKFLAKKVGSLIFNAYFCTRKGAQRLARKRQNINTTSKTHNQVGSVHLKSTKTKYNGNQECFCWYPRIR